jgi:hypothetical protein
MGRVSSTWVAVHWQPLVNKFCYCASASRCEGPDGVAMDGPIYFGDFCVSPVILCCRYLCRSEVVDAWRIAMTGLLEISTELCQMVASPEGINGVGIGVWQLVVCVVRKSIALVRIEVVSSDLSARWVRYCLNCCRRGSI